jgi:hypothetical protein
MQSSSTWTHSPMRVVATVSHAANHTPPIKQHCLNDLLRSLHLGGDLDDPTDHRRQTIECSPQPSRSRVQKFVATTSRLDHEIREEELPRERLDSASLRSLSSWSETTDLVFHDEEDSIQSDRTLVIHNNHLSTNTARSTSSSSTAKLLLSTWAPSAGMAVRRLPPKSSTSTWRPMSPSSLGTKQTRPGDDDSPPPDVTETASTSSSSSPDSSSSDDGHEHETSQASSNLTRREDSGPLDELFMMEQVSL